MTSVTVGSNPFAIAISGTGAYVANQGDGTVSIIDTSNPLGAVTTVTVGSGPLAIAISGTGAYVANQGDGTVSIIDTSNPLGAVTTVTVGLSPYAIAIASNSGPQPPANFSGSGGPKHTSSSGGFQLQAYNELFWSASPGAVSYNAYRAIGNADPVYIGNSTSLTFIDLAINWRQGYYYTVRAVDGAGNVGNPTTPIYISYR